MGREAGTVINSPTRKWEIFPQSKGEVIISRWVEMVSCFAMITTEIKSSLKNIQDKT